MWGTSGGHVREYVGNQWGTCEGICGEPVGDM